MPGKIIFLLKFFNIFSISIFLIKFLYALNAEILSLNAF